MVSGDGIVVDEDLISFTAADFDDLAFDSVLLGWLPFCGDDEVGLL